MNQSEPTLPLAAISEQERLQLLRIAYRICWNYSDAEDAVQNALLQATTQGHQLRDPSKRWPWLCRLVVQQCQLLGRKQQRHRNLQRRTGLGAGNSPAITAAATGDATHAAPQQRELDTEELGKLMRRLLIHLPPRERLAVTLRNLEQMEYAQIARVMEVSESTVRAHARSGRETLRRLILSKHPEWEV